MTEPRRYWVLEHKLEDEEPYDERDYIVVRLEKDYDALKAERDAVKEHLVVAKRERDQLKLTYRRAQRDIVPLAQVKVEAERDRLRALLMLADYYVEAGRPSSELLGHIRKALGGEPTDADLAWARAQLERGHEQC
jgi:hypothetical protein